MPIRQLVVIRRLMISSLDNCYFNTMTKKLNVNYQNQAVNESESVSSQSRAMAENFPGERVMERPRPRNSTNKPPSILSVVC